jgi:hypothetical protein
MPLRYRHIGFSLSVSCQWLFAFITVFAGPIAAANPRVGWKIWIWFLVFNFLSIFYVWLACPETRGKSLEEIDLLFVGERLKGTPAARTLGKGYVVNDSTGSSDGEALKDIRDKEVGIERVSSNDSSTNRHVRDDAVEMDPARFKEEQSSRF